MNNKMFMFIVVYGLTSLIHAAAENFLDKAETCTLRSTALRHLEEHCSLQRAATVRAVLDHPFLGSFLTNIRENKEHLLLSGFYIDDFIAAQGTARLYEQKLDRALKLSDMTELKDLLHSADISCGQQLDRSLNLSNVFEFAELLYSTSILYDKQKLIWLMMDSTIFVRMNAVENNEIQRMLSTIYKCPVIKFFSQNKLQVKKQKGNL